MKKYKLIKEYPGSPELGQIALPYTDSKNQIVHYIVERNQKKDCDYIAILKKHVEDNPDYWEEVNDIYYMVSLTDMPFHNAWEPIRVEAIALDTDTKKYFSTEEGAKSFILFHKPCLSYNEVKEEIKCQVSQQGILQSIYHIVKSRL
jgi:hypothetical protein